MSTSTGAFGLAAASRKKSSRKVIPRHLLGGVASRLVLGCAWTVYTNIFGAGIYPSMKGAALEAPVVRQSERCSRAPGAAGLQRGVRLAARRRRRRFPRLKPRHLRLCLTKGSQPASTAGRCRRGRSRRRRSPKSSPVEGDAENVLTYSFIVLFSTMPRRSTPPTTFRA